MPVRTTAATRLGSPLSPARARATRTTSEKGSKVAVLALDAHSHCGGDILARSCSCYPYAPLALARAHRVHAQSAGRVLAEVQARARLVRARSTTNICRARGSDPSTSCRTSAFGPLLRLEQHGRRALGPARDFPSLIRPSPLVHFSFYNSSLTSPNLANRHSDEPLPCSAFIYALQRL